MCSFIEHSWCCGCGTRKIRVSLCHVLLCAPLSWGGTCSGTAGFQDRTVISGLTRAGSEVTSVSSSSGIGSSLAPEIPFSPSCCCGATWCVFVWRRRRWRRQGWWRGDCLLHLFLKIQWRFSGWQMLLNLCWPRERRWPGWVTGLQRTHWGCTPHCLSHLSGKELSHWPSPSATCMSIWGWTASQG